MALCPSNIEYGLEQLVEDPHDHELIDDIIKEVEMYGVSKLCRFRRGLIGMKSHTECVYDATIQAIVTPPRSPSIREGERFMSLLHSMKQSPSEHQALDLLDAFLSMDLHIITGPKGKPAAVSDSCRGCNDNLYYEYITAYMCSLKLVMPNFNRSMIIKLAGYQG